MNVTTDIKRLDCILLNIVILPRMKSTYISIAFVATIVFSYLIWKKGVPCALENWVLMSVSAFAGGAFAMLFGIVISTISILLMSSTKNGVLGVHDYVISPEGLYEKTSANESLNRWEGIHKIMVAGPYLLFQISGYLFHLVPKRSFESIESFNEFVDLSNRYWGNVHNK